MIEITAIYDKERHRFENADGDVIIASARIANGSIGDPITIKGKIGQSELESHLSYRFYGRWTEYQNKRTKKPERQFAFSTFVESQPHGRAGIITYLKKAGEGNGIGQARATKIWERFGSDGVRLLRESPEVIVAAIKGLSLEQAKEVSKWLRDRQELEDCTIEVSSLLNGRGFPKSTAGQAIREWGNAAAKRIKRDPYQLMKFRGCGFKRCDNLYLELGLDPARLRRQAFCAWYAVASDTNGHTWYPAQHAADGVVSMVGGTKAKPTQAIKMARRICRLNKNTHGALAIVRESGGAIVESDGQVFVAEGGKAWCEEKIAAIVANRIDAPASCWPDVAAIADLTNHQREQVSLSLGGGPIAILGGSPGTGKTFTAARLIAAVAERIGIDNVASAAPTGKAAVRLTELMRGYGLSLNARTWHSLLGVENSESGIWSFTHNEDLPWPYKLIVGDESSMNDTNLMSSIVRALPMNCCLLLIGDVNQLSPVGHGAPLRDLIAAGLPYGELREIKRNSGGIVEACAAIRDGRAWEPGDNLKMIPSARAEDQIAAMIEVIGKCSANHDPAWDCQVLVAVNERSKLSRKVLNKVLQAELNQNQVIAGTPFRVADKVVCLKNSDFPLLETESGEADQGQTARVMNGELGKVIEIAEKYLTVSVDAPYRLIRVPRGSGNGEDTGCSWDLGYALSVHKSQGSEWPVVIVMIDDYAGARMVCDRSWIYTAISRAKDKCILIGKKSTADAMCQRVAIDKRKTFLRERILQNVARNQMAGM
jgi:exodeoxyribonuclease V alpha subunit